MKDTGFSPGVFGENVAGAIINDGWDALDFVTQDGHRFNILRP